MSSSSLPRRSLLLGAGLVMAAPQMVLAQGAKPRVRMMTSLGPITIELEDKRAPLTSANFLRYVDAKAYDGGSFFRAARNDWAPTQGTIVAQPPAKSRPFAPIRHESTTMTGLSHVHGAISLGRFAPGTATNTFFICLGDQTFLDAQPGEPGDNLGYAVFGKVVSGLSNAQKILAQPTGGETKFVEQKDQWLKKPVIIETARRA
ncbi:MAG: peptidylprolyl isomerase [Phenylobacterium sp.]|uniref:peptidylprolyl isomerase n=1 Tax=Phenylobacterium sp. TaxID=1871053 RepID=UPI0025DBCE7A|nr:peptidylprolyl isomerase [Phenylobacterium sp.]MCG9915761.1 peptidylprolyl isomerase [Phenylobacterium sp.]